ncbi:hypothetical protein TYRP_005180 [Tyrophagus putrescentiae]|nr:hypothetical protein TYRP_005180 [Tyrophagus putrescentiae]
MSYCEEPAPPPPSSPPSPSSAPLCSCGQLASARSAADPVLLHASGNAPRVGEDRVEHLQRLLVVLQVEQCRPDAGLHIRLVLFFFFIITFLLFLFFFLLLLLAGTGSSSCSPLFSQRSRQRSRPR